MYTLFILKYFADSALKKLFIPTAFCMEMEHKNVCARFEKHFHYFEFRNNKKKAAKCFEFEIYGQFITIRNNLLRWNEYRMW